MQTTSFDPDGVIVRYLWNFGNGRLSDTPDGLAVVPQPGTYTITHTVTDDDGATAGLLPDVTVVRVT